MIDLALVHFRAVDLRYFEAALYSVLRQRGLVDHVRRVLVLDNDTGHVQDSHLHFARECYPTIEWRLVSVNHGDESKRSQSWSVNEVFRQLPDADRVMFTRSDYILDFTAVQKFSDGADFNGFVTSYAYHMAYDERGDQRIEGMRDIEWTGWRTEGPQVLLDRVNGWRVDSSDRDAGVWLTRRYFWELVGGLDERLAKWGLQQTVFQQALHEAGVKILQLPEFLFFHQHHGGTFRDYDAAVAELEQYWGPREKLRSFRDISGFVGKVCDELDKDR